MAKKGGQQQLQADIQTDEEFEKFLERKGLLVMDVYTEWCGPCLAMVGSLKKIKLELGGDNLQLAICKSDTIEALKRFYNKSEPTWLFASCGRIVNIMFGTNVPKLMQLIAKELEVELAFAENKAQRTFYEKYELLPIEKERLDIAMAAENEAKKIEQDEAERKRTEYLTFVTTEIMTNLPECGVTIFAPHVNRDLFKKISEPAEDLGLSCRDRRVTQITPADIDVLQYKCDNPIDEDVLNFIFNKDLLICLWKLEKPDYFIEEVLHALVEKLTQSTPVYDELGVAIPGANVPALIQSHQVVIEKAKLPLEESEKATKSNGRKQEDNLHLSELDLGTPLIEDAQEEIHLEADILELSDESKEPLSLSEGPTPESSASIELLIPPVWTPADKVTNAAAIYLYFRSQTEPFLPPDPIADPPHLAIAFEAYKRKDILEVCENYKDAILTYGYFNSAIADQAKLIANSTKKYETQAHTIQDKLILKVAKVTSHAILGLSAQGPMHISQNTVLGQQECRRFFPAGYKTGEDEELESSSQIDTAGKKKKKKKKKNESGEIGESADSGVGTLISDAATFEVLGEGDSEDQTGEEQGVTDDYGSACEGEGEECLVKRQTEDIVIKKNLQ